MIIPIIILLALAHPTPKPKAKAKPTPTPARTSLVRKAAAAPTGGSSSQNWEICHVVWNHDHLDNPFFRYFRLYFTDKIFVNLAAGLPNEQWVFFNHELTSITMTAIYNYGDGEVESEHSNICNVAISPWYVNPPPAPNPCEPFPDCYQEKSAAKATPSPSPTPKPKPPRHATTDHVEIS